MTDRLLTPDEVSQYLGVPVATLYRWRYRGEGPRAVRIGRHLRYQPESVAAFVKQALAVDRQKAKRSPPQDPNKPKGRESPALRTTGTSQRLPTHLPPKEDLDAT